MDAAAQQAFKKKLTRAMLIEAAFFAVGLFAVVATGNVMLLIPTALIGAMPVVWVALNKRRLLKPGRTVE